MGYTPSLLQVIMFNMFISDLSPPLAEVVSLEAPGLYCAVSAAWRPMRVLYRVEWCCSVTLNKRLFAVDLM